MAFFYRSVLKHLLLIFLLAATALPAQLRLTPDTNKRVNFLAIPAVYVSPETNWAFGASGSVSFKTSFKNDPNTRTSIIQALGIYTLNKQYVGSLDATIYFPKEKYILYGNCSYSYFPDKFWGVGPHTINTDIERYSTNQLALFAHLKRKVVKRFFAGLIYDYRHVYNMHYWAHGNIDTNFVEGREPYDLSGGGISLSYDTRNNTFYPSKGFFVQAQLVEYNKAIGSGYDIFKCVAEARYFRQLHKYVISATQLYAIVNDGTTPLKSLAALGGSDNLRGFYQGRFRDKVYMSLISELRFPVTEHIGFTVFGGTGNVSSSVPSFDFSSLKYSFGGGLRLAIRTKDRLNLRIDYGYSDRYNNGFYFTIGEAF